MGSAGADKVFFHFFQKTLNAPANGAVAPAVRSFVRVADSRPTLPVIALLLIRRRCHFLSAALSAKSFSAMFTGPIGEIGSVLRIVRPTAARRGGSGDYRKSAHRREQPTVDGAIRRDSRGLE